MQSLLASDLLTPEETEEALRLTRETADFLSRVQERMVSDPKTGKMLYERVLEFNQRSTAQTQAQELSKKRYRKLAMKHHPDRGGDTAKFQAINDMQEQGDICGLLDAERGIFVRKESKDLRSLENTIDFYVRTLKVKNE